VNLGASDQSLRLFSLAANLGAAAWSAYEVAMNLLEVLGAFCFGVAIVFFVRLGLSSVKTAQVKVFTGIMCAVIGGGTLLLLGSIMNNAVPWPEEFWAYPVGLAVGLSLSNLVWKTSDVTHAEFTFKRVMVVLFVVGGFF